MDLGGDLNLGLGYFPWNNGKFPSAHNPKELLLYLIPTDQPTIFNGKHNISAKCR